MKSRIKKLLAAALALCLIAALVPGAALAASTPTGPFEHWNVTATAKAYSNTLSAALSAIQNFDEGNKIITLVDDYTITGTETLPEGVKFVVSEDAQLTISGALTVAGEFDVNSALALSGALTINSNEAEISSIRISNNGTLAVNGELELNGALTVDDGNVTVNGTLKQSGVLSVGDNTVTVNANGRLVLDGTLNIGNGGTVTANGTIENNGSIVLASAEQMNDIATLDVNQAMTGNGDISLGKRATASFPVGQFLSGEVTIADEAVITGSSELIVKGKTTVEAGGQIDVTNLSIVSGSVNNSGTIAASVEVNNGASLTIDDKDAKVTGQVTVHGTLNVELGVRDEFTMPGISGKGTVNITGGTVTMSAYNFEGTTNVSNGTTFIVGSTEKVGKNSINGAVKFTDEGSTTVMTINGNATVNGVYTVPSSEKLVVEDGATLDVANNLTVEGQLVVDGNVNINSNRNLKTNSPLTGNGKIYVTGQLYNANTSAAGNIEIQIIDDGLVYSQTTDLGDNIPNGETTGGGSGYSAVWQRREGSNYKIKVVPGNNGDVINPPSSGVSGTQVSITASPADGYMVDQDNTYYMVGGKRYDSIGVNSNTNVCTFTMPENEVTVHINFKKAENSSTTTEGNITVVTNHNGNGTVNASINGRVVTVTVRANTNYVINTVSIAGRGQTVATDAKSGTYSYTVPGTGNATVEVYVTFKSDDFEVTLTNYTYDDGRISLSTGTTTTGRYAEGERVTIYAFPDRDFYVRSLTITRTDNRQTVSYSESSTSDDVFYFTMPASDVTVRAYFTDGVYEISTDIDGSGRLTITGEDGNVTDVAEEGEEIRITASPSNNYRLGDIYVNYTDSDDEDQVIYPEVEYKNNGNVDYYWFEMPEYDVEIYADFGEGDYVAWIDRSDMENGTIRVSPNVADEDDTVSIYVTPDTGYQLDELIVEDEDGHDVTTSSLASGTRYTFRMPDSDVTVTATFKSRSYSSNFTDVPRYEWYYEAVSYVASEGLMNGVSTTQFNPNGTASRAQIVTILWRLAGEPSALTGAFTDVPAGQYYSTAVAWASRQGIVTGVGNNRFEPNSNITREQLAVILYRYAQDAGYTTSASANITGYYDYARVNSYARTAMSWAVGAGLITGTSTTTLSPQDTATRAQVATILMRFCENIAK